MSTCQPSALPSSDLDHPSCSINLADRHFDTAQRYGNETSVGASLRAALPKLGLGRGDVWVTTKIGNPRPGSGGMPAGGGYDPTLLPGPGGGYMLDDTVSAHDGVLAEFAKSQSALGFDYVDLLLLHYPSLPSKDLEGTDGTFYLTLSCRHLFH